MDNREEIVKRIQDYCKQNGNEVSKEDAETFVKFVELGRENKLEGNDQMVYNFLSGAGDELSDKDLEAVAGGQGVLGWILDIVSTPFRAIGTVIGSIGVGIGTPFQAILYAATGEGAGKGVKLLWSQFIDVMWGGFGK